MNRTTSTGTGPILVVSASAGTGHVRAGDALLHALRAQGVDAEHVDVLRLAPPWVKAAYGGGFEMLAQRAPRIWREIYARTDGPSAYDPAWGPLAHRILFRGFRALLDSAPWQACIATHFLPAQLAAGMRGAPPFSLVVTDYELHRYWAQPRVAQYFVSNSSMVAELGRRLPGARAVESGIPVDPRFAALPDARAARHTLGLAPDRPVALVMGGGIGIGIERTVFGALGAGVPDLQIVAICGRNDAARERLAALGLPDETLRVLGYVNDIHRFFAAASVVITKPGGLSTSEALAAGRPLLLTRPIPGHEEANVHFLRDTGAAFYAPKPQDISCILSALFHDPDALAAAAAAAQRVGRPDAAASIVRAVIDGIDCPIIQQAVA